jgi:hypothetical protein
MPEKFERDTHFIFLNYSCRAENQEVKLDNREAIEYTWERPGEVLNSDLDLNSSTEELIEDFLSKK